MPYGVKRIPIGAYRERVAIQVPVMTDDGMGGQTIASWQTVSEPAAFVSALDERTKEALAAQALTARHGYHVMIRYQTGIRPTMRIIVRDTTMQIHTVVDDEGRRRRLVLQVGEVQTS